VTSAALKGRKNAPNRNDPGQKFYHFDGMTPLTVEKIQSIPHLLDGDGIFLCAVFQDKLLKVQKCPLMRDLLAYLDESFPCVFGGELCAVRTLAMLD
jgi:hypothetical protein